MNKIIVSAFVAALTLGASVASAQSYYASTPSLYTAASSAGCTNLTRDLAFGSTGSDVSSLQRFLVAQNYPGGGSWMITGNFKSATQAAVRDFQQSQGLAVTGVADASTRAAIAQVTCGYSNNSNLFNNNQYYYNQTPTAQNPYNYNYNYGTNNTVTQSNCYYVYPYNCNTYNNTYPNNNYNNYPNNNYYGTVILTSMTPTSGTQGTSVTIYGNGFDYSGNTVYFGNQAIGTVASNNGTSLTFVVPSSVYNNSVGVYVTDSRGTSNILYFTVVSNTYNNNCNVYPYNCNNYPPTQPCTSYNNNYGYTYCPQGSVQITALTPSSANPGTTVFVTGTGFDANNNNVNFGGYTLLNIPSQNGTSLSFTVPQYPNSNASVPVYVVSSHGTSNTLYFTVSPTGGCGVYNNCNTAPSITSVSGPTTLGVNSQATWNVQIQNPGGGYVTTSVSWGDTGNGYVNMAAPQVTYTTGASTLSFSHAFISAGTYTITFTVGNQNGQSNTSTVTVTVGGSSSNGSISLASLSPTSGHIGTQIMLTGSGFTGDNTIHFGNGGTMHVPSQSGTYLYYTVPSYLSPCDVTAQGTVCAQYLQVVNPGSYPVYVTNTNGTSQTLNFQVN